MATMVFSALAASLLICVAACRPVEAAPGAAARPPAKATGDVALQLERAASRLTRVARAFQMLDRFSDAALQPGGRADVIRLVVDPALPSPFGPSDACTDDNVDANATLCHTRDGNTIVCSQAALQTLSSFDASASAHGPPVIMLAVVAHELGHLAMKHESGNHTVQWTVPPSDSARRRRLRLAFQGPTKSLVQELHADGFASRLLEIVFQIPADDPWLGYQPAIAPDGASSGNYYGNIDNALVSFFLLLEARTQCLSHHPPFQLPVGDTLVQEQARALVCDVLRARTGARMPYVIGSHADWITRLRRVQATVPNASHYPGVDVFELIDKYRSSPLDSTSHQYRLYHERLATAVRRLSLTLPVAACAAAADGRSKRS